jgi:aminocarboxymuconate-semialdehyde decarboxylase
VRGETAGTRVSVDVHNHAMPREVLDLFESEPAYGVSVAGGRWSGVHHVPFTIDPSFHDPAAKLAWMDARDIPAAVVSPPPSLFFYDAAVTDCERLCAATNEGLASFCAHAPGRLRWLANLPMQDPDAAVSTYRAAARAGASGAAVGTSVAGSRLDEDRYGPFWREVEALAMPVLLHPAFNEPHRGLEPFYLQNVVGNPLETTLAVERLVCAGVLARQPGVRLVLVHGGGFLPYQAGRLLHASGVRPEIGIDAAAVRAAFGQLYFDTVTHDPAALRFLVERVGIEHVVLGTDMPFDMAEDRPIARLTDALGDAAPEALARNAERLFGLGGAPAGR